MLMKFGEDGNSAQYNEIARRYVLDAERGSPNS